MPRGVMRMTMADMADLADATPGAYRLENADTYLTPPEHVLEATRAAVGVDEFNSYLPLRGLRSLREAIATHTRKNVTTARPVPPSEMPQSRPAARKPL